MALLGSAVSQVYYVRASEAIRHDVLTPLTENVFRRLVALGLLPILAIAVGGPEVFRFVFGESWSRAGLYAAYLSPWVFLVFVSSPLSRLFDLLEKQRELLLFNVVLLVVRAAALYYGGVRGDADLAILLFGIAGAAMWLVHTVWMLALARVSRRSAISVTVRYLATALLPLSVVVAAKLFGGDLLVTAAVVVAGGMYYFLLLRAEPDLLKETLNKSGDATAG